MNTPEAVTAKLASKIIEELANRGGWHTMNDIAVILRRKNGVPLPHDRKTVNDLVSNRLLDIRFEEIGAVKRRALYRVSGGDHD